MEPDLLQRVAAALEELRLFASLAGILFHFDAPQPPQAEKGVCRLCTGCVRHPRAGGLCQSSAYAAALQGFAIGDVWYTRCWLGVDCFVVPLAPRDELVGAIEVGGFFSPGEGEKAVPRILGRLAGLDPQGGLEPYVSALQGMRETEFMLVRAAAEFLLEATFAKGLNQPDTFSVRQKIFKAERRLSAAIPRPDGDTAGSPPGPAFLRHLGAFLADDEAPAGRSAAALEAFTAALTRDADGDLTRFKAGVVPLLATLACARLRRGESWHAALGGFEQRLLQLERLRSIETVCSWLDALLNPPRLPATPASTRRARGARPLAGRLEEWFRRRPGERLSLTDAAEAVGASRSSIVHRLRTETGQTFRQLRGASRICEAKRLLAFTDLSIGEVSRRCGFRDQSYFTKVFHRHINLTPRQFRQLLGEHGALDPAAAAPGLAHEPEVTDMRRRITPAPPEPVRRTRAARSETGSRSI
jgi:AraC-like DNA-binding protein